MLQKGWQVTLYVKPHYVALLLWPEVQKNQLCKCWALLPVVCVEETIVIITSNVPFPALHWSLPPSLPPPTPPLLYLSQYTLSHLEITIQIPWHMPCLVEPRNFSSRWAACFSGSSVWISFLTAELLLLLFRLGGAHEPAFFWIFELNLIYFFIQQVLISYPFYTYSCIHVNRNIPIHHTTTPAPHTTFHPWCPYICSLHLCLNSCPENRFICTIFLGSTYMH